MRLKKKLIFDLLQIKTKKIYNYLSTLVLYRITENLKKTI